MPAYRLIITDDAELDIAEARHWYQEQAGLGADFMTCIGRKLEFVEQQPLATPVVVHGIRRAVVSRFPYNIYYAINGQFINVLAVWHGSRDQGRLLSLRAGTSGG